MRATPTHRGDGIITAQKLEMLASLMDDKTVQKVKLF
jgi:hypothetical protein